VRRSRLELQTLPIGEAIFLTRRALRLSGPKLAKRSGVHKNTISLIECGIYAPSIESLVMIAKGLEVEVSTIIHRAEKLRPSQEVVQHVAEDKIA
jgi:transcriptional regulator with XRE-family HTH domain